MMLLAQVCEDEENRFRSDVSIYSLSTHIDITHS